MRKASQLQQSRLHTRVVRLRNEGDGVVITDRALVETPDPLLPLEGRSLRRVVRLAARILSSAFGHQRV